MCEGEQQFLDIFFTCDLRHHLKMLVVLRDCIFIGDMLLMIYNMTLLYIELYYKVIMLLCNEFIYSANNGAY